MYYLKARSLLLDGKNPAITTWDVFKKKRGK